MAWRLKHVVIVHTVQRKSSILYSCYSTFVCAPSFMADCFLVCWYHCYSIRCSKYYSRYTEAWENLLNANYIYKSTIKFQTSIIVLQVIAMSNFLFRWFVTVFAEFNYSLSTNRQEMRSVRERMSASDWRMKSICTKWDTQRVRDRERELGLYALNLDPFPKLKLSAIFW